jgi:hypothetical protein
MPFGQPPQCLFFDATRCRAEAQRLNALCGINGNEVLPPRGGQRFCLVRNGPNLDCSYTDRRSCDFAATPTQGFCIDAGDANARPDPDLIPR